MAVTDKTVKKQCPNCGSINEFATKVDEDVKEQGSMRVSCKSCSWKFKISSPGLVASTPG